MHPPDTALRFRTACLLAALSLAIAAAGCDRIDEGDLGVAWRFNGTIQNGGCDAIGADRAVIEVVGVALDVVACDNLDTGFPMTWWNPVAPAAPSAFGRVVQGLAPGDYTVRLYFLDAADNVLTDPAAQEAPVKIAAGKISTIDFDFTVTTGSVTARWRIGGALGRCADAQVASTEVTVTPAGGGTPVQATAPCDAGMLIVAGLAPGSYDVSVSLRDAQGGSVAAAQTGTAAVVASETQTVSVDFPWDGFTVPLTGNLRFQLAWGAAGVTTCAGPTNLTSGPVTTQTLGLRDSADASANETAFPNPAAQVDCTGLTGGLATDGVTSGSCVDPEQIVCDLQVGTYHLLVTGFDAAARACYQTDFTLVVGAGDNPATELVVEESTTATPCFN